MRSHTSDLLSSNAKIARNMGAPKSILFIPTEMRPLYSTTSYTHVQFHDTPAKYAFFNGDRFANYKECQIHTNSLNLHHPNSRNQQLPTIKMQIN